MGGGGPPVGGGLCIPTPPIGGPGLPGVSGFGGGATGSGVESLATRRFRAGDQATVFSSNCLVIRFVTTDSAEAKFSVSKANFDI